MINLLPIITGSSFNPIEATGGTIQDITVNGIPYRVHIFTTSGTSTFTVSQVGDEGLVEYLIVGGGGVGGPIGGSGSISSTGGGGAGGYLTNVGGTRLAVTATAYTIVVGSGGSFSFSGGFSNNVNIIAAQNSSVFGLTAIAGGNGGFVDGSTTAGGAGGSGGGGVGGPSSSTAGGAGQAGPPRQGYNGASGSADFQNYRGGGGGGSSANASGASGGAGTVNNITGSDVTYAAGGSARTTNGSGSNAVSNTGNGGQGAANVNTTTTRSGGNGGSGIVVIRYPLEIV